jgi:DNA-binding MarR family transcriptional regulator
VTDQVTHRPDPALDDLLCFDLYAAQRAVVAAYRPVLAELGLTYPQYLVLVLLWERDGLAIKELATRLRLDHATLTPLLRRMEQAGLVARERSLLDERSVTVRLVPRGEALREHQDTVRCAIADAMGLDVEAARRLAQQLREVSDHLGAAAARDAARP